MIVEFYSRSKPRQNVGERSLSQLTQGIRGKKHSGVVKALVCAGILQGGLFNPSHAAEFDPLIWTRTFTNLCLQETYSTPNALEALFFVGQRDEQVSTALIEKLREPRRLRGDPP